MSVLVDVLKRKFILIKNGTEIELEDINPLLTPEEICDMYTGAYPELVNCSINKKGIVEDAMIFEFSSIAGTKA